MNCAGWDGYQDYNVNIEEITQKCSSLDSSNEKAIREFTRKLNLQTMDCLRIYLQVIHKKNPDLGKRILLMSPRLCSLHMVNYRKAEDFDDIKIIISYINKDCFYISKVSERFNEKKLQKFNNLLSQDFSHFRKESQNLEKVKSLFKIMSLGKLDTLFQFYLGTQDICTNFYGIVPDVFGQIITQFAKLPRN